MVGEVSKYYVLVTGILAGLGRDPSHNDLIERMRSQKVTDMKFTDEDSREFSREMITEGFGGNAEDFILAIQANLRSNPVGAPHMMFIQSVRVATDMIHDSLVNNKKHHGSLSLKSLAAGWNMITECRGKCSFVMRAIAREMRAEDVDRFAESLPDYEKQLRDILAGGILEKIGLWRVWCWFKKHILGKDPDQAEAEMERERKIAVLRAKLEGAWIHPVNMNDPAIEKIIREEKAIYVEVMELDPDFMDWFNKNAPNNRRED